MVGINPFTKTRIRQRAKNVVGGGRRKRKSQSALFGTSDRTAARWATGAAYRQFKSPNHMHVCVCVCECHVILIKNGATATCSGLSGS